MNRVVHLLGITSVCLWSTAAFAQGASAPAAAKPSGTARTITITAVDSPSMKFDIAKIDAKPGEEIRIVLKTVSKLPKVAMAHNFVLLKAGLTPKETTDFATEAAMAAKTAYVPPAKQAWVLAHTPVAIGNGETTEVTFKAPSAPGAYPYLCSFPGHYMMGMKGVLNVVK